MNTEIKLKPLTLDVTNHKGAQIVLIKFPHDKELGDAVKKIKSARWTKTHTSWYAPYWIW